MSVSVLILTLNEETNLSACLDSVRECEDIVVLDSLSDDKTVEIARSRGVRVIQRPFDNYAAQRNAGLNTVQYKHSWVLMLDADERVTPELWKEMNEATDSADPAVSLFHIRRKDYWFGQWFRRSSGYPTWFGRLVRVGHVTVEREINEQYVAHGESKFLTEHLIHYPFNKGVAYWLERHNRYSSMEAVAQAEERRQKVLVRGLWSRNPIARRQTMKQIAYRLPVRPLLTFGYLYFARGGFLDGRAGLCYCILRAIYEYMIDVKVKERVWNEGERECKTKTIFINRYFYPDHSATSQLLSDLAFDLASRGQNIHVITGGQLYGDPRASLSSEEVIRGVNVFRVRTSRFGRARLWGRMLDYLTFYLGATWRLLRSIQPGDVVVAETDPPMMSVFAAWVVKARKGILVNWIQDLFPEVATSLDISGVRFVAPMLKRLRNGSLRQARSNVVLGAHMARRLRDEGIPSNRIRVIENWADGDVIQPVPREDNLLLREWRLEGKFVLGYSGNMGHVHEFKTIIDAVELLKGENDIAFVFIGDGVARPWLEAETAARGLTNVQFRPYQPTDRLRWSLSVPDVHLVSLRPALEGLIVPSKFYGIAAAGRAVIHVGDLDGEIPHILEREQCGWSYCVGEAGSLARCILELSQRPTEVAEAGLRARRAFDRQYARAHALKIWRALLGSDSVTAPLISDEGVVQELPVAAGGK